MFTLHILFKLVWVLCVGYGHFRVSCFFELILWYKPTLLSKQLVIYQPVIGEPFKSWTVKKPNFQKEKLITKAQSTTYLAANGLIEAASLTGLFSRSADWWMTQRVGSTADARLRQGWVVANVDVLLSLDKGEIDYIMAGIIFIDPPLMCLVP